MEDLIELGGEVVQAQELTSSRAAAFARYAGNPDNAAFDLVECRRSPGGEGVVVRVCAEVPQRPRHDIRHEEPFLVLFDSEESGLPDVLALRRDFPDVPHLNLRREAVPKSLCLFAERPEDLLLRWTSALLGERILWWLKETARGTLHRQDQPLEPFLSGVIRPLIVPPNLFASGLEEILSVYTADAGLGRTVFVADRPECLPAGLSGADVTLLAYALPAQEHGVIRLEPQTLDELHALCADAGFDLLKSLRQTLYARIGDMGPGSKSTMIVLAIPKTRDDQQAPEDMELRGFRCGVPGAPAQLRDAGPGRLGEALGVLARSGTGYVPLFPGGSDGDRTAARNIGVQMLMPLSALTPDTAALLSGHEGRENRKFVAVGQGAIGSQLFANLVKQGYGQWDLIDEDYLLPHNLVRHAVMGRRIGAPKAQEMAARANELFSGPPIARGIVANVLALGAQAEAVTQAMQGADVILDMSASVAVSRSLALDVDASAMRVTAFLSPSGRDLIVMSEGRGRAVPMDSIEAQYLRAVLNEERLAGHLASGDERIRYGGSCRDLSARISPENVALHAGLGAAAVRQAVTDQEPMLSIWRYDPDRISIERINLPVGAALIWDTEGWTIVTDELFLDKIGAFRRAKLPNETCGVLLGHFDTRHKRIYLVDALPAPPDSQEQKDGCQRGIQGLQEAVTSAAERTLSQVEYVGEWHSHPDGAVCLPSSYDAGQMDWVKAKMHPEGKPALILIACENHGFTAFLVEP